MSTPSSIVIDAALADTETPVAAAVEEQLAECLAAASGHPWHVESRLRDGIAAIDPAGGASVAIASLLPELARAIEPIAETQARWRTHLDALARRGIPAVVCTIFRHVAPTQDGNRDAAAATIERIRRLDLVAAELSHDTGASVADVDRVLAHLGARQLASDHRLGGPLAAEVAAWTIVAALLDGPLDAVVDPDVLQRAQAFQGRLWEIDRFVNRRMRRAR